MKTAPFARLLAVIMLPAATLTAYAQLPNPEAVAFVKTYQTAYNSGNLPALMPLFTDNVGWVNPDASVKTYTKADVEADFVRDFGETAGSYMDFAVVSTEAQPNGKLKVGTTVSGYDFLRKTNAKLNPTAGTYEMLLDKVGKQWKISQVKWNMNVVALEMRDLVKQFQGATNREDVAAIKGMFATNAVRTDAEGVTTNGADAISEVYAKSYANADVNTLITMANVVPQFDGSVLLTGAYHANGRTVKGNRVATDGAFSNTVVKENGQWKVSQMKLTPITKTMIYHNVADYAAWKKGFDLFYNERALAGELSAEIGTLQDDPNTVYVINEWASPEAAKAFFTRPELAATMQKAGVSGKPTFLIMSKK